MEFPIEAYLQAVQQKRQAEEKQGTWASALGQGVGAGIKSGADSQMKMNQEKPAQRSQLFRDMISKNALFNTQGQMLELGDIGKVAEVYKSTGNMPAGIQMVPLDVMKAQQTPEAVTYAYYPQTGEFANPTTGERTKTIPPRAKWKQIGLSLPEKELEKKTLTRASQEEQMAIKREAFGKDLENFIAVDTQIKRGSGMLGRVKEGLTSTYKGIAQETGDDRGKAVALHDAASKRLRVQLVRAAGDVGNINVVEQEAAEQLIPKVFDSEGVASAKRTYLKELGKAVNSMDSNKIREVFNKAGIGFTEKSTSGTPAIGQQFNGEEIIDVQEVQ